MYKTMNEKKKKILAPKMCWILQQQQQQKYMKDEQNREKENYVPKISLLKWCEIDEIYCWGLWCFYKV